MKSSFSKISFFVFKSYSETNYFKKSEANNNWKETVSENSVWSPNVNDILNFFSLKFCIRNYFFLYRKTHAFSYRRITPNRSIQIRNKLNKWTGRDLPFSESVTRAFSLSLGFQYRFLFYEYTYSSKRNGRPLRLDPWICFIQRFLFTSVCGIHDWANNKIREKTWWILIASSFDVHQINLCVVSLCSYKLILELNKCFYLYFNHKRRFAMAGIEEMWWAGLVFLFVVWVFICCCCYYWETVFKSENDTKKKM